MRGATGFRRVCVLILARPQRLGLLQKGCVSTHVGSAHTLLQGMTVRPGGQAALRVCLWAPVEWNKLTPENGLIKVSGRELRAFLLIFILPLAVCDSSLEGNGILLSAELIFPVSSSTCFPRLVLTKFTVSHPSED